MAEPMDEAERREVDQRLATMGAAFRAAVRAGADLDQVVATVMPVAGDGLSARQRAALELLFRESVADITGTGGGTDGPVPRGK